MGEFVIMVAPGKSLNEEERDLLARALPPGERQDVHALRELEDPKVRPGWAYLIELEDEHG